MTRQEWLMGSGKENERPLYKITWREFNLLWAFEGELGNKSISKYAALSDMKICELSNVFNNSVQKNQ